MTNIGIIGIGFMGYTHFEAAKDLQGARIAAIATRNEKRRLGDWSGIQGNFGPPAGQVDLSHVKAYADYQELLRDPEIHLVDICLPTDLHEQVTIEALQAGKAVLVEKPIALTVEAGERMVAAAKAAGKPLMVGHVLPFFPEFRFAADAVRSGQYGRLLGAHFRRVIAPPEWSKSLSDFRNVGGWGIDLHIHDNHFIATVCGVPRAVFSQGLLQDSFVNHVHTQYVYPESKLAVSCVSGGIAAKGLAFGHGFELYLEQATILFDAGTYGGEWVVNRPLTLIDQAGHVSEPELSGGGKWCSAFTLELQQAVNATVQNAEAGILSGQLALDALRMCYAEAESIGSGQVVPV